MNSHVQRLLLAFGISAAITILASFTGVYVVLILPMEVFSYFGLPNYGHSATTSFLLVFIPIITYTMIFWIIGTTWSMMRKAYE
jgi:hypothetical protein